MTLLCSLQRRGGLLRVPRLLLALNLLVNFFAVDRNMFRRSDPDTYLVPLHPKHGHGNIIPDLDRLADSSREYEHDIFL